MRMTVNVSEFYVFHSCYSRCDYFVFVGFVAAAVFSSQNRANQQNHQKQNK